MTDLASESTSSCSSNTASGVVASAAGRVADASIQATPAMLPSGSQTVSEVIVPKEIDSGASKTTREFRTALDHEESIRSQFAMRLASAQGELRLERNSSAALRTQIEAAHNDLDKVRGEKKVLESLVNVSAGSALSSPAPQVDCSAHVVATVATQTLAPAPRLDVRVGADEPFDLANCNALTTPSTRPAPTVPSVPSSNPGGGGRPRYKALVSMGVAKPAPQRLASHRPTQAVARESGEEAERELLEALAAGRFSGAASGLNGTPKVAMATARRSQA